MIVNKKVLVAAIAMSMAALILARIFWVQEEKPPAQIVSTEKTETVDKEKIIEVIMNADNDDYPEIVDPYNKNISADKAAQRDQAFINKINGFTDVVNLEVTSSVNEWGEDVYLYFYVINEKGRSEFSVDLGCSHLSNRQTKVFDIVADPIQNNPYGRLSKNVSNGDQVVIWRINNEADGAQAMWFYASTPPVEREYVMRTTGFSVRQVIPYGDGTVMVGAISKDGTVGLTKGPACPEPKG